MSSLSYYNTYRQEYCFRLHKITWWMGDYCFGCHYHH